MQLGGRVNSENAKKLLAKQLGEFSNQLDSIGFVDCKTGRITGKILGSNSLNITCAVLQLMVHQPRKQKKTVVPEKQMVKDFKTAGNRLGSACIGPVIVSVKFQQAGAALEEHPPAPLGDRRLEDSQLLRARDGLRSCH